MFLGGFFSFKKEWLSTTYIKTTELHHNHFLAPSPYKKKKKNPDLDKDFVKSNVLVTMAQKLTVSVSLTASWTLAMNSGVVTTCFASDSSICLRSSSVFVEANRNRCAICKMSARIRNF